MSPEPGGRRWLSHLGVGCFVAMPSDRTWTRFTTRISPGALRAIGKLNVPLYRATRGRLMGHVNRAPVLLLTTTGRRSGQQRTAPVLFRTDGDRVVVIGSNAGTERAPAWALNLLTHPEAEIQIRGERRQVRARVADGEERERLWRAMNDQYGGFEDYAGR